LRKFIKTEAIVEFLKPSGKFSKYYTGAEEEIIGVPSLTEKENYKIIIPPSMDDIDEQVCLTEKRGEKVVKYLEMYKGQNIYNDIALAIEFGYQLKLEEDE
jgi:hypothetical protein